MSRLHKEMFHKNINRSSSRKLWRENWEKGTKFGIICSVYLVSVDILHVLFVIIILKDPLKDAQ